MYIKVLAPKTDGPVVYNNSGSCARLVNYLSKEDQERGVDREFYFDATEDYITSAKVIRSIDDNRSQLGKDEAKFYTLVIAPTPEEMEHINNDIWELKRYTRDVMDVYAAEFKNKNGVSKNLKGEDLTYFAKVEYNRYYNGTHEKVIDGEVTQGKKKPGPQYHVHIIVARKDKLNKQKLSPLANDKKLFHRKLFKLNGCELFDKKYQYQGAGQELKEHIFKKRSEYDQACFQHVFVEVANNAQNKKIPKRVEDISFQNNAMDFGLIDTINKLSSESSEEQTEEIQNKESIAKKNKNRFRLR